MDTHTDTEYKKSLAFAFSAPVSDMLAVSSVYGDISTGQFWTCQPYLVFIADIVVSCIFCGYFDDD